MPVCQWTCVLHLRLFNQAGTAVRAWMSDRVITTKPIKTVRRVMNTLRS